MYKYFLLIILISLNGFSETYTCKFLTALPHETKTYENHKFSRSGNKLIHKVDYQKKYDKNIYSETSQYIIAGRGIIVYKIDKQRLSATENYLYANGEAVTYLGKCRVTE